MFPGTVLSSDFLRPDRARKKVGIERLVSDSDLSENLPIEVIRLRKTTDPTLFDMKGLLFSANFRVVEGVVGGDSQEASQVVRLNLLLSNPPPAANVAAAAMGTTFRPMVGMMEAIAQTVSNDFELAFDDFACLI